MARVGLFLFAFAACGLLNRGQLSSVDEGFIFNTTESLVKHFSFRMDEELSNRRYSRFSPLPSVIAVPFYWAWDRASGSGNVDPTVQKERLLFACGLSSCIISAWTAVALAGWFARLGYSQQTCHSMALLWVLGTMALPYSSTLFHQVLATVLFVYVCRFALDGKIVSTAIAAALLVSVQLTLAATIMPLFLREQGKRNWNAGFGLLLGIALGTGLHIITNLLRGDPWLAGAYDTETFTTPAFVGTVGLFFSAGKGLLWFAPIAFVGFAMLLPLASRKPELGRPLLMAAALHCVVVIHWWAWHGSLSWGPRLLLPILPIAFVPLADWFERRADVPIWQRRGLWLTAIASIAINISAATQPMIGFLNQLTYESMSEWMFLPGLSPLVLQSFDGGRWRPAFALPLFLTLLFSGAIILWRSLIVGVRVHELVPWRAAGLMVVAVAPWVYDNFAFRLRVDPQSRFVAHQRNSETGETPCKLVFPIRGTYVIEVRDLAKDKSVRIASSTLTPGRNTIAIEAPPMQVPVSNPAGLYWTIPGEGQFRKPIPPEYFEPAKPTQWQMLLRHWRHYHWLLYLLAIPFLFDWLLGGRKTQE